MINNLLLSCFYWNIEQFGRSLSKTLDVSESELMDPNSQIFVGKSNSASTFHSSMLEVLANCPIPLCDLICLLG